MIFYQIILQVIFPLFLMIGAGACLHRMLKLHLATLSAITINFLLPAVCFVNIYKSNLSGRLVGQTLLFLLLFNLLLAVISLLFAKANRFDRQLSAVFKNSFVLSNSGNYGLPVSELVFVANPAGTAIQVIVSIFQNLLTFTYGVYNSISAQSSGKDLIRKIMKLPVIYALVIAIILRWANVDVPDFIWQPIENASEAFSAIALITLGAQVAYLKITHISKPVVWIVIGRLIISPCVALLIIFFLGLSGTVAQALFIASSFPTSRNSALLALEHNNYPDMASQAVLLTTVFSSGTVAVVIYLSSFF